METGESQGKVGDFSAVLKEEVTNPRKDTPFVVLISLLATLALARAFVLLTGAAETTTETSTYIGRNLIIGGYHIHHFFYGFALICAAAWIAIQYPTRNLPRLAAVLFRAGLGLCVAEMGYFLGGQVNYFDRTTYFMGLWTLQPWARKVAILFAIVSLGTDVVSILTGNYGNAVALLFDLLLIWYLTRPGVRAAFVRVDRSAQGTQESN